MLATNAPCARLTNFPAKAIFPLSLPKSRRLLRPAEFRTTYQSGIRMTSRYFAAFCLHSQDQSSMLFTRFGFTTPRAFGKSVVRNRAKRRLREAVKSQLGGAPENWSIVFNPRRSMVTAPFEDLCREVGRILERCKSS